MDQVIRQNKVYLIWITAISIAIPVAVAALLFTPYNLNLAEQNWVKQLPIFNAIINTTTSVALISAVMAIKAGKITLHRNLMTSALMLGTIFLVSYVIYHASADSVKFGDLDHDGVLSTTELDLVGSLRGVYLLVLLSHIGLSIVVVPFVLLAFYKALTGQIEKHKKIVKFTFPIWLYVSISGVIVYLLINPYYI